MSYFPKFSFPFLLFFLWCMLNGVSTPAYGQEILTLYKEQYDKTVPGSDARFDLVGKYAQALYFHERQEQAQLLLKENIQLAEQQSDKAHAAYLYAILAMNAKLNEQTKEANKAIGKALTYAKEIDHIEIKAYVNYCQGWIYVRDDQEAKAVQSFLTAITWFEKAPQSPTKLSRLSATYKELTSIYASWDDYELQEKYSKLTLDVAIQQNNPNSLFDAYMMMGYLYESEFSQNNNNIYARDLAENYYKKAIKTYKKNQELIPFRSDLAFVANNLASLYLRAFPKQYKEQATYYATLALEQAKESNQANFQASSYGILAEIALQQNETKTATAHLLSALSSINSTNLPDKNTLLSIYESLAYLHETEGNNEAALYFNKLYLHTYQSIYDQDKLEVSKRLEAQYEKEQQKQQLLTLQLAAEKKEQQIQLMKTLGLQQLQELENLKLLEENQRKKLEISQLETETHAQALKLSQLENDNKLLDIQHFKKTLSYQEKLKTYFLAISLAFAILVFVLLYVYKQRTKSMKQQKELYNLALEKEKQHAKIATLTALLDGQEQERSRLARDLHDGLGGLLSGTKIQLSTLNNKLAADNKAEMDKSMEHLDNAVDELRRVAHNLMPDLLIKYGLEEALKEYANRMSSDQLDIDVQFLGYTHTLEQDKQLLVYRIIQELVNNALKHANPQQIIIQLVENEYSYMVTIEDDGCGFELNQVQQTQSAGLHNIQSRVQFLKGDLHIHSELNLGTSIDFQFPKN
ncbi:sensor histidine kinase [Myroides sp. NP-2]|uniref:tetratricopeptide repeat-containing sensor histidine kinase n=1 Tax=Myroides sp. NP-2 TaxID=2759945 RepID=UPI0015F8D8EE|nr:sensor histidine kinase [Myroides sp. NP-2]MBB1150869.1 sensor histidine kinase [Myroides sp. NP-2]